MHGLETVAHVGQSPAYDHAHGVIEVGALHLVGDGDRPDIRRAFITGRGFVVVRHGNSPLALETGSKTRRTRAADTTAAWRCGAAARWVLIAQALGWGNSSGVPTEMAISGRNNKVLGRPSGA